MLATQAVSEKKTLKRRENLFILKHFEGVASKNGTFQTGAKKHTIKLLKMTNCTLFRLLVKNCCDYWYF